MFYRNIPKLTKKLKYTRLKLNFTNSFDCDKDYLNVDFPKYCIHFNNENNELINSYGDNDFCCSVSQNGDGLLYPELGSIGMLKHLKYFLKTDGETGVSRRQMIVEDYNSNVYFSNLDDGTTNKYDLVKLDDNCDSRYFSYYHKLNNYLIISTLTGEISKLYVYDGDIVRTFEDVDFIYSICTLNDYVFIVKADAVRNKVYFYNDSNPYNLPFNISKMQSIGVPVEVGQIEKILNYNDCLYVICEYGIVRIQFYKNQDEFDIEEVCYGLSKVVCGSIVKGDDSIFLATDDFVYQLKGNSIEKIE